MIYHVAENQTVDEIISAAGKLRTPDNIPPVTLVMPWLMGDGNRQMIALDDLETLR